MNLGSTWLQDTCRARKVVWGIEIKKGGQWRPPGRSIQLTRRPSTNPECCACRRRSEWPDDQPNVSAITRLWDVRALNLPPPPRVPSPDLRAWTPLNQGEGPTKTCSPYSNPADRRYDLGPSDLLAGPRSLNQVMPDYLAAARTSFGDPLMSSPSALIEVHLCMMRSPVFSPSLMPGRSSNL